MACGYACWVPSLPPTINLRGFSSRYTHLTAASFKSWDWWCTKGKGKVNRYHIPHTFPAPWASSVVCRSLVPHSRKEWGSVVSERQTRRPEGEGVRGPFIRPHPGPRGPSLHSFILLSLRSGPRTEGGTEGDGWTRDQGAGVTGEWKWSWSAFVSRLPTSVTLSLVVSLHSSPRSFREPKGNGGEPRWQGERERMKVEKERRWTKRL